MTGLTTFLWCCHQEVSFEAPLQKASPDGRNPKQNSNLPRSKNIRIFGKNCQTTSGNVRDVKRHFLTLSDISIFKIKDT